MADSEVYLRTVGALFCITLLYGLLYYFTTTLVISTVLVAGTAYLCKGPARGKEALNQRRRMASMTGSLAKGGYPAKYKIPHTIIHGKIPSALVTQLPRTEPLIQRVIHV